MKIGISTLPNTILNTLFVLAPGVIIRGNKVHSTKSRSRVYISNIFTDNTEIKIKVGPRFFNLVGLRFTFKPKMYKIIVALFV